ncbi:MAG: ABC transporter permease [Blastocatellia bacterium]|jgi:ABC-type antimicrobial peptide transport system permease subunit
MSLLDIIDLAFRNLRQAKLRTFLTMLGVIIGVAAIVTMVSFGIGLQKNLLRDAFARIDIFTSLTIIGPGAEALLAMREGESGEPVPRLLDDNAIAELRAIPGVRYVQPQLSVESFVRFEGRTRRIGIGGAPTEVDFNPRFRDFIAGRHLRAGESDTVIVTEKFLARLRQKVTGNRSRPAGGPFAAGPVRTDDERRREAETLIGQELTLLTLPQKGGETALFGIPLPGEPGQDEEPDRFEKRNFRIVGVLKAADGIDFQPGGNLLAWLPFDEVRRLRDAQGDSLRQLGEMLAGETGYQNAELRVVDLAQVEPVRNELKRRGFNFFSLSNQLEDIQRVFLIVNASLALIGGLALLVASFGISNTMIMSIRERTREIGIMKAIGGADGEIMKIFFVEAGLIGFAGGLLGLFGGWAVDRIANLLANQWVARQAGQAIRQIEFFSIPWYLAAGAILFALVVSLIAAIYPARYAAKIDPIRALRYD